MRILVTTGPTREPIDPVRFITNASSGRMGVAVAGQAAGAGHAVTLLAGPGVDLRDLPAGVERVDFVSVADLKTALHERSPACDALVMAAAVGDFQVANRLARKIPRSGGPISLRLVPTEDLLASLAPLKRPDQVVIAFAVEDGPADAIQAKARREMKAKSADYVVVNRPEAMSASESDACILGPRETILPWAVRPKDTLAAEIVRTLERVKK